MPASSVYRCPVCGKLFDRADELFDFALAAHEKDHAASRNDPSNLIVLSDQDVWCCKLCRHPFGIFEASARIAVIAHARDKHGSAPASSAPDMTRGGRGQASRSGSKGLGKRIEDGVEAVFDFLGDIIKID